MEIEYGLPIETISKLQQLTSDLSTAIQCAIDEANTKGQFIDPILDELMASITSKFEDALKG